MKNSNNNNDVLGIALRRFLGEYLPRQRAFSHHTILSYRDSLKSLLRFTAGKRRVSQVMIADLSVATVLAFLNHLEHKNGNGAGTRNVRLGAIHSFFDYLGATWPEHLDQAQRVLAIGFKRTISRSIDYLDEAELRTIVETISDSSSNATRDRALLILMFNTGARVQEVVSLRISDLRLDTPPSVNLMGKGRKERICPLWPEAVTAIRRYLEDEKTGTLDSSRALFLNHRGTPLTRFGARLILKRHIKRAAQSSPSLRRKRIHPHSMRHSAAMHLLRSGVDLSTIAHWLGHNSINTTNKYLSLDLEAKRAALAKAGPIMSKPRRPRWRTDALLEWLESL
jgi:site-specific recombinase XerD